MHEDLIARQATERIERMLAEAAAFRLLVQQTPYRLKRRVNPLVKARRAIAHALVSSSHGLLALSDAIAPCEPAH